MVATITDLPSFQGTLLVFLVRCFCSVGLVSNSFLYGRLLLMGLNAVAFLMA